MHLLHRSELLDSLRSPGDDSIFIEPILDEAGQVGATTIDLRLGYDFLVSIMTRRPSIDLSYNDRSYRHIQSHFQETRRDLGDTFVLYPNQVVLSMTLEYIALPGNMFADIATRSSFNRLGIQLINSLQPGYRGCASLELCNHGHTPIELVVGSRLVQARIFRLPDDHDYLRRGTSRKYLANVRPLVAQTDSDDELARLAAIRHRRDEPGENS
jgi:dCTP deaminase